MSASIDLTKLDTIRLDKGAHRTPDAGLGLMEAVAYIRGIDHTNYPPCVSLVLGTYGRALLPEWTWLHGGAV